LSAHQRFGFQNMRRCRPSVVFPERKHEHSPATKKSSRHSSNNRNVNLRRNLHPVKNVTKFNAFIAVENTEETTTIIRMREYKDGKKEKPPQPFFYYQGPYGTGKMSGHGRSFESQNLQKNAAPQQAPH
jgi:hypothetical protein